MPGDRKGGDEAPPKKASTTSGGKKDEKADRDQGEDQEEDHDQSEEDEDEEDDTKSANHNDVDDEADTGLTDNQNKLLYMISLYSKPAFSGDEKEEWVRKSAMLVLLYEGIVAQVFDYDYAPASELIDLHRKFINITQEGKTDLDFLREEELISGLKISSKSHTPLTCYQISEKGLALVNKISKDDKAPVQELIYAPGTRNKLMVEWDGEKYWLGDSLTGFQRLSSITETESVSYVSSAYIPQCLRHGGRPTLSNAHRAHECGSSQGTVRDELDEIITLNSVSIIVGEYIPFGPNRIVQLNESLGSADRVQGGFFTATLEEEPGSTKVDIEPGMTQVNILDYSLTEHLNVEADIHFPEAPGVIQIETFGCHVNSLGTCFYGMQVEAITDRIKDNMSLDHMARLLVDVQTDSSKIIDSIIAPHQRDLLNLIFAGNAACRNKVNLIIANEITPHLTAEEYMDKGDYENELRQVIGDTRAAFDISEHDTLIFGADGLLIAGPNARHHEPLLCAYMQFVSLDAFLRNFFNRLFILLDDMKLLRNDLDNFYKNPNSWDDIRQKLVTLDQQVTLMEEILGYLDDSHQNFDLPNEPAEQAGRALFERLQLVSLKDKIQRRTKDLFKTMGGARRELEMLKDIQSTMGEIRALRTHEKVQENTKQIDKLVDAEDRTNRYLEIMQLMFTATLSFEIMDRITGQWTVVNTEWMRSFVEPMIQNGPLVWFIMNMLLWAGVAYGLIRIIQFVRKHRQGSVCLQIRRHAQIDVGRLRMFVGKKTLLEERHIFDGCNRICRIVWEELDPKDWGGSCPLIQVEYDEENAFMLQVFVGYTPPRHKNSVKLTAAELEAKVLQDLEKAEVFTQPISGASRATKLPFDTSQTASTTLASDNNKTKKEDPANAKGHTMSRLGLLPNLGAK